MKNYRLLSFCSLLTIISCATNVDDVLTPNEQSSFGGESYWPYPKDPPKETEPTQHEYYWNCGTEWIEIEGPNGEIIRQEIPLICDPSADFYVGCPEKINSIINQQTK